jgi:flavin reductase (DIM6/NTAB) family NADH-FMN oxidoreductase RutF
MPDHSNGALVSRESYLHAMRRVASSVAVVTTNGPAGCHGATVSAFSSVSADPPTVLVCLRSDSRIARAVAQNNKLCVNVLSEGRSDIASRFAGRDDGCLQDRFTGIDVCGVQGEPPEINGSTSFSGRVVRAVTSGSHIIFICEVGMVSEGDNAPLTYLNGAYHFVTPHATQPHGGQSFRSS